MGSDTMDVDDLFKDSALVDSAIRDLGIDFLRNFCRTAATSFFKQYGLISHQLNSYNKFITNGIQNVFDSIGEITIEPGFDLSRRQDGEWRYASFKFGKVTLGRPGFFACKNISLDDGKEFVDMLPRHAHLQNMTYSSRMKVHVHFQVYTQKKVQSDKVKAGEDHCVEKAVSPEDSREIIIGGFQ